MATKAKSGLPLIRACLFDVDGLLINSEDLYSKCTNEVLHEYGKPDLPWSIKAHLQGRTVPEAHAMLCDWAKLPISDDEFLDKIRALQARYFPTTQLLPGVEDMLQRLRKTGVQMALATSSTTRNFNLKTAHLGHVFEKFDPALVVRGDDPRLPKGRGKPAPDIFLLALQTINDSLAASGKPEIHPEECLVFEDSVPGVEAGRRAGMQVVWCPHEGLMGVYQDRKAEVLAGSTGQHKDDGSNDDAAWERKRDEWVGQGREHARVRGRIGEIDDGWAILYNSLENFSLDFYGIV